MGKNVWSFIWFCLIFEMGKSIESTIAQGEIADARGLHVQSTITPNHASDG
jgi:hypothetical protein